MPLTIAIKAASFLQMLGVCTHISYTDGGYANIQNIADDLKYLSVTSARDALSDGANGSAPISTYIALARRGVHFTALIPSVTTTRDLEREVAAVEALQKAVPGSIEAVEGPNEINNFPLNYNGRQGLNGAIQMQADLYAIVKQSSLLASLPVVYFTGYGAGGLGVGPNPAVQSGLADYGNQHPYPRLGQPPYQWIDPKKVLTNAIAHIGPFVFTETGYSTHGAAADVVDQQTQAAYIADLWLDAALFGAHRVYIYQLMDAYPADSRQGDEGFGLFDVNNLPKLSATMIRNIKAILDDGSAFAPSFKTTSLTYDIDTNLHPVHSLLLQKANGTFDLALWSEPLSNAKNRNVKSTAEITVRFIQPVKTTAVYDPIRSSDPVSQTGAAARITVSLSDHPLIIAVSP